MKILIVKDGTVPVIVARVFSVDVDPAELEHRNDELEVYEVEDGCEALYVTWEETMGMEVSGITMREGYELLQGVGLMDDSVVEPFTEVEPGHLVTTVNPGDREWYIHVVDIGGF